MKYGQTDRFKGDIRRLSDDEKKLFASVVRTKFIPAAENIAASRGGKWPTSLRVKDVEGAPGIWEMTWSFYGPDGRATFEWRNFDGEPGILWRRVGGHEIFKEPTGERQK